MKRTKGEIEAEISKAVTQWEKDFLGRGSSSVKSDILRDMVTINSQGVLTPVEYRVCGANEGLLNIKRTRSKLVESGERDLNDITFRITGIKVMSLRSDLSIVTGERIIASKFEDNLEKHIQEGQVYFCRLIKVIEVYLVKQRSAIHSGVLFLYYMMCLSCVRVHWFEYNPRKVYVIKFVNGDKSAQTYLSRDMPTVPLHREYMCDVGIQSIKYT